MVSLKVISITPNRNLNTPKVIFVTLGILFQGSQGPLINFLVTRCRIVRHKCGSVEFMSAKLQNKREYSKCPKLGVPLCLFLCPIHAFYFLAKLGQKLAFKKYGFSGFYLQDL